MQFGVLRFVLGSFFVPTGFLSFLNAEGKVDLLPGSFGVTSGHRLRSVFFFQQICCHRRFRRRYTYST